MYSTLGVDKVFITELIFGKAPAYQKQFLRPYDIHYNSDVVNSLQDITASHMSNYNPMSLSAVVPNAIILDDATDIASIPNGWETERLKFKMTVDVMFSDGSIEKHMYQGYTSSLERYNNGDISPNTTMIINSERKVRYNAATGNVNLSGSDQYLMDDSQSSNLYSTRPEDVFTGVDVRHLVQDSDMVDFVTDSTGTLSKVPKLANRNNTTPGGFLSSLLNASITSSLYDSDSVGGEWGTGEDSTFTASARGLVRENIYNENPLIAGIESMNQGNSTFRVTLGDLYSVTPNLQNTVIFMDEQGIGTPESEYMDINSGTSVIASTLATQTSALMMRSGLSFIQYTATNRTTDGAGVINPTNGSGLVDGAPCDTEVTTFCRLFVAEVMNYITMNGSVEVLVEVSSHIYSDTTVRVKIGDGVMTPFVFPVFADSLFSPLVTTNTDNNLVDGILGLGAMVGAREIMSGDAMFGGSGSGPEGNVSGGNLNGFEDNNHTVFDDDSPFIADDPWAADYHNSNDLIL